MKRSAGIALLLVVTIALGLNLIDERYKIRLLSMQSEKLKVQAQELDIAWRHLQSERAELARYARLTQLAKEELALAPTELAKTIYLQGQPSVFDKLENQP